MVQQPESFQGHFYLTPDDCALLPERPVRGRLGFAILLRFFRLKGRFPQDLTEIPKPLIDCISEQLGISAQVLRKYKWEGRTIERHRAEIRSSLGFREATVEDIKQLQSWLLNHLENNELTELLDQVAYERLQQLQLEPPTKERLERSVNSVIATYEQQFYQGVFNQLSEQNCHRLEALLETAFLQEDEGSKGWETSRFAELQKSPGKTGLESVLQEVSKLQMLQDLRLPSTLFSGFSPRFIRIFQRRAAVEPPRELRRHPPSVRYSLLSAFCWGRMREITDHLVELLIQVVHRIGLSAEKRVTKELFAEFKQVQGKNNILFLLAEAALQEPDGVIRDVLFPVVGEKTFQELVKEFRAAGPTYRLNVQTRMKSSYSRHYRRMLPKILSVLTFRSNNALHQPVIEAVELLTRYKESRLQFYPADENVPIEGVVKAHWRSHLYKDEGENKRIHRISYELCVLEALRERLRTKEVWIVGANRWRNPDEDLPQDFGQKRSFYYEVLAQPLSAKAFNSQLQERMHQALLTFDQNLPKNPKVSIRSHGKKRIKLSPLEAQPEAPNIRELKRELVAHWPMTNLLDILKETDLRLSLTEHLRSVSSREVIAPQTLRKRLLLCLYGLGTNIGLKRISSGEDGEKYKDLIYVRRRFLGKEQLRSAISQLSNEILSVRLPQLWGETTTSCASDSKHFGAWDQNLMTEWHSRYGGRGIMIYWHVGRKATCVYSQLKRCSSSEVAAMIEGVLHHCTEMEIEKQYVDSHGQSLVAFAFCQLLGFRLLPRLKGISGQKLFRPCEGEENAYQNLQPLLTRPIKWDLLAQQYDEIIKYTTALRLGTAEAEAILRRFTKDNKKHPTYQALLELGRAVKTIFLCEYLGSEKLRHEIQEGLNVIELWNGVNDFILIGKKGEMNSNQGEAQELFMLCLHLLQNSLIYVNTLMIQEILEQPHWRNKLTTSASFNAPTFFSRQSIWSIRSQLE